MTPFPEARSVVITGAARGLGLACAAHLYQRGWQVLAAMRAVDAGMANLRAAAGADHDDPRLIGIPLDLTDSASIERASGLITETGAAPYGLVHNAGISAAGMVEETPVELWQRMFATNLFGPVALTTALLPAIRAAGRGRIVLVSSAGGVRGMPATAPYSAVKGALERWGESMANEVAAFGIGVTILVAGTYDTEIITDAGTTDCRNLTGVYARHHATMDRRDRLAIRHAARPPRRFAEELAKALGATAPFVRRPAGPDARMLMAANRVLPGAALHHATRMILGLPRFGTLRGTGEPAQPAALPARDRGDTRPTRTR
jgi:NAD(P)-dependent dehydrogenase (short-subunit alcohol dehydrogenase family)